MFNFFKKKIEIYSPIKGSPVMLDKVNDPVFSNKMIGDGVAILPEGNFVCAPCKGKIIQIFPTNHAFGIVTEDGLEVLVHIGLDTVELKGKGFKRLMEVGENVTVGEKIIEVDFDYLKSENKDIITPIVFTNMEMIDKIEKIENKLETSDVIMKISLKNK